MRTMLLTFVVLAGLRCFVNAQITAAEARKQFEKARELQQTARDFRGAALVLRSLLNANPPEEFALQTRLQLASLHLTLGERDAAALLMEEALKVMRSNEPAPSGSPAGLNAPAFFPSMFETIEQRALSKPDRAQLMNAAMNGIAESIGQHAEYFEPPLMGGGPGSGPSFPEFGVGIALRESSNGMHVTQVIRSLSAWQAGVQPGWILTAIDGRTWSQFAGNLRAAHQAIRGPEGTTVSLTFRLPDGGERVIELARKKGSPSSVEGILSHSVNPDGSPRRIAENGIVTTGLSSFYEPKEGTPQWRGAAEDLRLALIAQTASAYLIDLRNTQGGNLEQAIKIADLFLKQGVIVSIRSPDRTEERAATTGDELPTLPMAVLVNSWTSSVAEVVAAALQDHRRAAIIGRRTAGRAIMRDFIETPGGGSLLLPVSELLRSTGARLERDPDMTMKDTWGVIPDQIAPPLEPTPSNTSQPEENYQRLWDTTPPDQRDAALKKDVQYQAALEYLKAQLARK